MVKLIVKTIVINGKIHKNKRKRFYSSGKVKGKGVIFLTGHISNVNNLCHQEAWN
jgi:hypothetical protein